MTWTTLVDSQSLDARLAEPSLVVADCRFDLKEPSAGERAYQQAHIPGAVYVHLDRDMAGAPTGSNGRHPLPDPTRLAATVGRLGITSDTQVVAYDQDSGMYASRLWWILRWLGHDAVAVLNGGLSTWLAEGRPTTAGVERRPARAFEPHIRHDMVVSADDVAAHAELGQSLLDARAPERFRGDVEPLDRVAGHIPGARNHWFQSNLTESGRFRPAHELALLLGESLGKVSADRVICYCGSGVTACHNLLALEHAGLRGAKLYAGSWSEWSSDPARPVERS